VMGVLDLGLEGQILGLGLVQKSLLPSLRGDRLVTARPICLRIIILNVFKLQIFRRRQSSLVANPIHTTVLSRRPSGSVNWALD